MIFGGPASNLAVKTMFQAQNILVDDGDFFYYIAGAPLLAVPGPLVS